MGKYIDMSRCCYEFECKAIDEITCDDQPKSMDSCPFRTLQKAADTLRDLLQKTIDGGSWGPWRSDPIEAINKYNKIFKGGKNDPS